MMQQDPTTIVSDRLARRLSVLYAGSAAAPAPIELNVEGVLEAPVLAWLHQGPAAQLPARAASDHCVLVPQRALKQLHVMQGAWALLTHECPGLGARSCMAQVFSPPPGAQLTPSSGALLSPLAAFNLGVQYALAPFILGPEAAAAAAPGPSSDAPAPPSTPSRLAQWLGTITIQPLGPTTYKHQRLPSVDGASPSPSTATTPTTPTAAEAYAPAATLMRIAKVARPNVGPLAAILGGADGPAAAAAAATSDGGGGGADGGASTREAGGDALERASLALQQYLTACTRWVGSAMHMLCYACCAQRTPAAASLSPPVSPVRACTHATTMRKRAM